MSDTPNRTIPEGVHVRLPRLSEVVRLAWREMVAETDSDVVCPRCGYPARGLSSPRCPECGANLLETGVIGPRVVRDSLRRISVRSRYMAALAGAALAVMVLCMVVTPRLVNLFGTLNNARIQATIGYLSPTNFSMALVARTQGFVSRPGERYPKEIEEIELWLGIVKLIEVPDPPRRPVVPGELIAERLVLLPEDEQIVILLREAQPAGIHVGASGTRTQQVLPLNRQSVIQVLWHCGYDTEDPGLAGHADAMLAVLQHACTLRFPGFKDDMDRYFRQMHPTWRFAISSDRSIKGTPSRFTRAMPAMFNLSWIVLGIGGYWLTRRRLLTRDRIKGTF